MWNLSSPTRDQTCTLTLEVWHLHPWTAKEDPPKEIWFHNPPALLGEELSTE